MDTCKRCKQVKCKEDFYRCDGCISGHKGSCKECEKEAQRGRYAKQKKLKAVPWYKRLIQLLKEYF